MILGETPRAVARRRHSTTCFGALGVRHQMLAIADPPNRQSFTHGSPRALIFAQADRAISAFAASLRDLGLPTDSAGGDPAAEQLHATWMRHAGWILPPALGSGSKVPKL